jgi:hypothetical protein
MKTPKLTTLLAAGVLLCGSTISASDECVLTRHTLTLSSLAAGMDDAFSEDLRSLPRHVSPSRADLCFRESLCQLAGITAQFHRSVILGAPACDLERGFAAVQEAVLCVDHSSRGVNVCAEIRGMAQQFAQAIACVQHTGFATAAHPEAHHQGHHHHHAHQACDKTNAIPLRVPIPQSLPFVFRQPFR